MAAETKRPKLGALHSVEAGLHMHQRAQAKRAAVAGERDPDALRGYRCGPAYVPRPNHRGAPPRWSNLLGRTADRVFGVMRRRWVRRVGLGMAGTLAVLPAGRSDAVVAPVERPDFPRYDHAMADCGDR